jgi:hypothetical protein
LKRYPAHGPTTDEDTLSLLRRLAAHYPDDIIAGILNRQGRKTAYGGRFSAQQVASLRRYHEIPRFVLLGAAKNGATFGGLRRSQRSHPALERG